MRRDLGNALGRVPVAAAFLVAPVVFAGSASAAASSSMDCSTSVVDGAHALGSQAATRAALKRLQAATPAARVFVRTFTSLPGKDPAAREKLLEQSCPEWRDVDGGRAAGLVSIIVDTADRKTGLFYGGTWDGRLGSTYASIETGAMNPLFEKGSFDAGVAAGLTAIGDDLSAVTVPRTTPTAGSTADDPTADDSTADGSTADPWSSYLAQDSLSGGTGFGDPTGRAVTVLGVLIGIVAVGGFTATIVGVRHSRSSGARPGTSNPSLLNQGLGIDPTLHHHHGGGIIHGGINGGGGLPGGDGGSGGSNAGGGGGGTSSW